MDDTTLTCLMATAFGALSLLPANHAEEVIERWRTSVDPSGQRRSTQDLTKRPIDELELSARPYNCLTKAGITTVGELVGMTESQLERLPYFGRRSLAEVRRALEAVGLELASGKENGR